MLRNPNIRPFNRSRCPGAGQARAGESGRRRPRLVLIRRNGVGAAIHPSMACTTQGVGNAMNSQENEDPERRALPQDVAPTHSKP
jgi:hypothetical protein